MSENRVHLNEVYYELTRVGNVVRVNAIDPITGTEVITVGDPRAGEVQLKQIARRKLEYVLTKARESKRK